MQHNQPLLQMPRHRGARDHFGEGRLLISSASDQLCLLRDKVERDPPLVRDYRGRNAGLATPQWPLCHIPCEQVRRCGRASFATGIHRSSSFASSSNSVPSVWSAAASASLQRLCACLALPPSVPHKPPLIENRMTIVVERKSPTVPSSEKVPTRRLPPVVKPIDLMRRVHRPANHLDRGPYLLR